jgi:hypothetical protein
MSHAALVTAIFALTILGFEGVVALSARPCEEEPHGIPVAREH